MKEYEKEFLTFYVVWNPTTGYTKFQHECFDAAHKEAERLALINPNAEFYVLQTVEKCKIKTIEWQKANPLPF